MIESFWGRMQTDLLNRRRWRTRLELADAIFEYLEIFHNRQRRHSALGMLTPIEFELRTTPSIAWSPATRLHVSRGTSPPPIPERFTPGPAKNSALGFRDIPTLLLLSPSPPAPLLALIRIRPIPPDA